MLDGHEEESQSGETTLDSDVLRLHRSLDCAGNFVSDSGSSPAEFSYSPSRSACR